MADWSAADYLAFEAERTRPAEELLARVALRSARRAVDLGCGPGNSTELLVRRFPEAEIVGIDSSPAMLAAARQRLPSVRFEEGDVGRWEPDGAVDLIFANAVLQWVPDHPSEMARLLSGLRPGGVLAAQIPDNLDEPNHTAMRAAALAGRHAARLANAEAARDPVPTAAVYYDHLAPVAASVDIWRTTYQHVLPDSAAVVRWLKATGLRPYLNALGQDEQAEFLADYGARIAAAYPVRPDGRVLLPFPRVFVVATRR